MCAAVSKGIVIEGGGKAYILSIFRLSSEDGQTDALHALAMLVLGGSNDLEGVMLVAVATATTSNHSSTPHITRNEKRLEKLLICVGEGIADSTVASSIAANDYTLRIHLLRSTTTSALTTCSRV